ncbi:CHAP domain-containing protein [Patescibacteria group bacterium]|nr:CHAP domain-containing protein [Patescibacteria group bacterium]
MRGKTRKKKHVSFLLAVVLALAVVLIANLRSEKYPVSTSGVALADECYGNCSCTDYAHEMRPDLDFIDANAKDWGVIAEQDGYSVDSDPDPGDIAVFQPGVHGADSQLGHVAHVTADNGDGTFNYNEKGFCDIPYDGSWGDRCAVHPNSNTVVPGVKFIHQQAGDPNAVLDSNVSVHPNPVTGGQAVSFDFSIRNNGGNTAAMKEIFVRCTTDTSAEWKAWATPQNIGIGEVKSFTASGDTWAEQSGIWHVLEIIYKDSQDNFHSVPANGYLLAQDFTVTNPDTTPPTGSFVSAPEAQ